MIKKLVRELEKYKDRFIRYEDLIPKILIRKLENVEFILKKLTEVCKLNADVEIIDLKGLGIMTEWHELRYILTIRFICSNCGDRVQGEINLNNPAGNYLCGACQDGNADDQYDRYLEEQYEEKEKKKLKEEGIL